MAGALPTLYSFRRCPYAMRARICLAQARIAVNLREVELRALPRAMLEISPKGTVPVLQLADGKVLEESLDIARWALSISDPEAWLDESPAMAGVLIAENDGGFKIALDRYKYFTRHPERPREHYLAQGESFLRKLENYLSQHAGKGLLRDSTSLADIAIFPFVRQFAGADSDWFETAPYPLLRRWLGRHTESALFKRIMKKYPPWIPDATAPVEDWSTH